MMGNHEPTRHRARFVVTYALTLCPPFGWWLYWYLFGGGDDGCGPPNNSTAGYVFYVVLFGLPLATAGIALGFGAARQWRPSLLFSAALITVLIGGFFELVVFGIEFGLHHCGE